MIHLINVLLKILAVIIILPGLVGLILLFILFWNNNYIRKGDDIIDMILSPNKSI